MSGSKNIIVSWVRRHTDDMPGCSVENLSSSFADGYVFAALFYSLSPEFWTDKRDFVSGVQEMSRDERLKWAFDTAGKAGIESFMAAEDVDSRRPDDKSILLFLTQVYKHYGKNGGVNQGLENKPVKDVSSSSIDDLLKAAVAPKKTSDRAAMRKLSRLASEQPKYSTAKHSDSPTTTTTISSTPNYTPPATGGISKVTFMLKSATLKKLMQQREIGLISEEEYQSSRAAMIAEVPELADIVFATPSPTTSTPSPKQAPARGNVVVQMQRSQTSPSSPSSPIQRTQSVATRWKPPTKTEEEVSKPITSSPSGSVKSRWSSTETSTSSPVSSPPPQVRAQSIQLEGSTIKSDVRSKWEQQAAALKESTPPPRQPIQRTTSVAARWNPQGSTTTTPSPTRKASVKKQLLEQQPRKQSVKKDISQAVKQSEVVADKKEQSKKEESEEESEEETDESEEEESEEEESEEEEEESDEEEEEEEVPAKSVAAVKSPTLITSETIPSQPKPTQQPITFTTQEKEPPQQKPFVVEQFEVNNVEVTKPTPSIEIKTQPPVQEQPQSTFTYQKMDQPSSPSPSITPQKESIPSSSTTTYQPPTSTNITTTDNKSSPTTKPTLSRGTSVAQRWSPSTSSDQKLTRKQSGSFDHRTVSNVKSKWEQPTPPSQNSPSTSSPITKSNVGSVANRWKPTTTEQVEIKQKQSSPLLNQSIKKQDSIPKLQQSQKEKQEESDSESEEEEEEEETESEEESEESEEEESEEEEEEAKSTLPPVTTCSVPSEPTKIATIQQQPKQETQIQSVVIAEQKPIEEVASTIAPTTQVVTASKPARKVSIFEQLGITPTISEDDELLSDFKNQESAPIHVTKQEEKQVVPPKVITATPIKSESTNVQIQSKLDQKSQSNPNGTEQLVKVNTTTMVPESSFDSSLASEIVDRMYVGNKQVVSDPTLLNKHRITHLVQLRTIDDLPFEDEFTRTEFGRFTNRSWLVKDSSDFEIFDLFDIAINYIKKILKMSMRNRIMIFDNYGKSLTPCIMIAYLLRECEMDYESALELVRTKSKIPLKLNSGFVEQLEDYDLDLQDERNGNE
ncbi:hypothetical protein AKO1_013773 [Acrasis kona]|uniref:Calponin-homology (CH) domain-containing protein n=1 Tax=Acrasis kona TaxID=1008807 RepID=A0AAW2ZIG8_9EUKA